MCNIVFLYNYTVYILYEKSGDGYVCMSKQAEKMSNIGHFCVKFLRLNELVVKIKVIFIVW